MIESVIFKANDIRGVVGGPNAEWDAAGARAVGAAFVELMDLKGKQFVLGRDMRVSGEEMSGAFADGAAAGGADVVVVGLTSTDQLWYASGSLNLHGVQFTASHNPPEYNGVKFCLPGAQPVSPDFLTALARRAQQIDGGTSESTAPRGQVSYRDTLNDYASYVRSLVDLDGIQHLKIVVDAGNGMAGHTAHAVLDPLDIELIGLFLDLDGTFPNHMPNPLVPENLVLARKAVIEHGADLGLVFDGDADRCFVIDERGEVVSPSVITALIAAAELRREPGATIIKNTITSRTVAEVVAEEGGKLVTSRVGHTYVKALMAKHNAIFGGEHSAHYYFRDFWGADTGMVAGLHIVGMRGHSDEPLSAIVHRYERYVDSGEINSTVADSDRCCQAVAAAFADRGSADWSDGLTVSGHEEGPQEWWFNLRASNTEPLLRLNVEAKDPAVMVAIRDEVLDLVRQNAS